MPDAPADLAISDEELTALALAADPDQPLDPDAVPFGGDGTSGGLLPAWYMPVTAGARRRGARRWVLGTVALGFVAISACGMCVTYGFPELPL